MHICSPSSHNLWLINLLQKMTNPPQISAEPKHLNFQLVWNRSGNSTLHKGHIKIWTLGNKIFSDASWKLTEANSKYPECAGYEGNCANQYIHTSHMPIFRDFPLYNGQRQIFHINLCSSQHWYLEEWFTEGTEESALWWGQEICEQNAKRVPWLGNTWQDTGWGRVNWYIPFSGSFKGQFV